MSHLRTARLAHIVILAVALTSSPRAFSQPIGTFRVDKADPNKHANEVSAAAAWNGSPAALHGVVAWNDYRAGSHLGVVVTVDAFINKYEYANTPTPNAHICPTLNLPSGHQPVREFDPMTAFDPLNGDLYVGGIWEAVQEPNEPPETGVFVARKPSAQTQSPHFLQAVNVIKDPSNSTVDFPVAVADKGWMTVGLKPDNLNATRVYITFNQSTDNAFLDIGPNISWSDDQGLTWSTPTAIPILSDITSATGPLPRVGPDGKLYVSLYDAQEGRILLQRSSDGGATWLSPSGSNNIKTIASLADFWLPADAAGDPRLPGNPSRLGPWACIAVNPIHANKLYCAFVDTTRILQSSPPTLPPEFDLDIYFTKSTDYGDNWTTPVKKFASGMSDQFFPWIEVDGTGRIHLSAYDTRHVDSDPSQLDWYPVGYYNNYYRYSTNDGQTWTETRLTNPSWILPCGTAPFFAFNDYAGMALANQTVVPVFAALVPNGSSDPNCPAADGEIMARIIAP